MDSVQSQLWVFAGFALWFLVFRIAFKRWSLLLLLPLLLCSPAFGQTGGWVSLSWSPWSRLGQGGASALSNIPTTNLPFGPAGPNTFFAAAGAENTFAGTGVAGSALFMNVPCQTFVNLVDFGGYYMGQFYLDGVKVLGGDCSNISAVSAGSVFCGGSGASVYNWWPNAILVTVAVYPGLHMHVVVSFSNDGSYSFTLWPSQEGTAGSTTNTVFNWRDDGSGGAPAVRGPNWPNYVCLSYTSPSTVTSTANDVCPSEWVCSACAGGTALGTVSGGATSGDVWVHEFVGLATVNWPVVGTATTQPSTQPVPSSQPVPQTSGGGIAELTTAQVASQQSGASSSDVLRYSWGVNYQAHQLADVLDEMSLPAGDDTEWSAAANSFINLCEDLSPGITHSGGIPGLGAPLTGIGLAVPAQLPGVDSLSELIANVFQSTHKLRGWLPDTFWNGIRTVAGGILAGTTVLKAWDLLWWGIGASPNRLFGTEGSNVPEGDVDG